MRRWTEVGPAVAAAAALVVEVSGVEHVLVHRTAMKVIAFGQQAQCQDTSVSKFHMNDMYGLDRQREGYVRDCHCLSMKVSCPCPHT